MRYTGFALHSAFWLTCSIIACNNQPPKSLIHDPDLCGGASCNDSEECITLADDNSTNVCAITDCSDSSDNCPKEYGCWPILTLKNGSHAYIKTCNAQPNTSCGLGERQPHCGAALACQIKDNEESGFCKLRYGQTCNFDASTAECMQGTWCDYGVTTGGNARCQQGLPNDFCRGHPDKCETDLGLVCCQYNRTGVGAVCVYKYELGPQGCPELYCHSEWCYEGQHCVQISKSSNPECVEFCPCQYPTVYNCWDSSYYDPNKQQYINASMCNLKANTSCGDIVVPDKCGPQMICEDNSLCKVKKGGPCHQDQSECEKSLHCDNSTCQ